MTAPSTKRRNHCTWCGLPGHHRTVCWLKGIRAPDAIDDLAAGIPQPLEARILGHKEAGRLTYDAMVRASVHGARRALLELVERMEGRPHGELYEELARMVGDQDGLERLVKRKPPG